MRMTVSYWRSVSRAFSKDSARRGVRRFLDLAAVREAGGGGIVNDFVWREPRGEGVPSVGESVSGDVAGGAYGGGAD
jgi:hypothetical protein